MIFVLCHRRETRRREIGGSMGVFGGDHRGGWRAQIPGRVPGPPAPTRLSVVYGWRGSPGWGWLWMGVREEKGA